MKTALFVLATGYWLLATDHQAAVRVSPGSIEILKSVAALPPHLVGLFRDPIGFKQTANGDYYVFDRRGHTVYLVDAAATEARKLVQIGAEDGRLIEPSAFDVAINGSFAVADGPNGRERVQIFDAAGIRTGGFILPGRGTQRIVLGSLALNGAGTLSFNGRSLLMSHTETGWLITQYGLDGTPVRSIGQLRKTGHEADRELHLALNSGIPVADPNGGFYFVFMAGRPAFRKYDANGQLLYERVIQGREIDPLVDAIPDRWPRRGTGELPLVAPMVRTAAVDGSGRLWVSFTIPFTYVYDADGEKTRTVQFRAGGIISALELMVQPAGQNSGHTRVLRVRTREPISRYGKIINSSMGKVEHRGISRRAAWTLAVLGLVASCSKTPTAPDPPPPPPPPVAEAPSLSCVEGVSRATVNAAGTNVSFDTPPVTGGQGSVTVSCSPQSGETFPIGTTEVRCTATDVLNRTGSCTFNVTVSKLAQLSKFKYFAFGDSITAGEVTVPIGGSIFTGAGAIHKQVVVPGSAYPAVLQRTLQGRYASQAAEIAVANYGLGGEKAADARDRFIAGLNTFRPEVVLMLDGFNDIPGGRDGAASTAASEVRIMVNEARRRGMAVFIGTPTPGKPGSKQIDPFLLRDYGDRMRVVAAQEGATLVDLYALMLPDASRLIGVDGLHPNELGYTKMADLFFQAIQAAFEVR